jgi:hypothetical protein
MGLYKRREEGERGKGLGHRSQMIIDRSSSGMERGRHKRDESMATA